MSIELLLIAAVVMMIFESGWWDEVDEWVSSKFRFHHLPKIFVCQFCQCFWLSLIYLLLSGQGVILSLFWALINANIGELLRPIFKLIKTSLNALIGWFIYKIEKL